MERRNFIRASAIGSACAMAGALVQQAAGATRTMTDAKCKITVLKTSLNQKWSEEFRGSQGEKCPLFKEGQEFLQHSPWEAPEGFCHWAWADIRTYIHLVLEEKYDTFVACCTDGFRPVFFKIERVNT